jgi:uracil-DNA glycosylase
MKVNLENSWNEVLKDEFHKPYFVELVSFVKHEYASNPESIFPMGSQIFRAFNCCPFDQVKVVILGQDPYPTKGHAHGLCFSVEENVQPLPKSLKNIFIELYQDIGVTPHNGDLSYWAEQGVLLLNNVLTVKEGTPGSHANRGWEIFTDAVIHELNSRRKGIVYVLWGSHAQKKAEKVNQNDNYVIQSPHPSPLSAYRGFFNSKPFSRANSYLKQNGFDPINW